MYFLAIETSCDETAAAVFTEEPTILANVIASQTDLHARFGGVVPDVATRAHLHRLLPVIDEVVATVLSQHTSDINSGRAFDQLRAAFPTWEEVRDASVAAIAMVIQSGGLAQMKAPRIKAILQRIWDERGSFDLDFLKTVPLAEAGVGVAVVVRRLPKSPDFQCEWPLKGGATRITLPASLVPSRHRH